MSRAPSPHGTAPRREDGVPERGAVVPGAHELDALLARVPGSADHHLDAADLAHRVRERLSVLEAEALDRRRSLDGDERVLVRRVAHLGAARLALLQPRVGRLAVAGVDDEEVLAVAHAVDDQVVDDPAVARWSAACTAPRRRRHGRCRSRAPTGGTPRRQGPRRGAAPCARRRTRPRPGGRRGAPGSRPRTGRASPSRRTARAARRLRRADRTAASGEGSRSRARQ